MDCAVSPSGDRVYVTNQGSNTVSVIDTTNNNTVIANVAAPSGSILTNLAVSPDNTKVFVVSQNTGVLILSTSGLGFNPTPITVGTTPIDVTFDSSGRAYVTNYTSQSVSIIGTGNTVIGTVSSLHEGPRGIAVANISGSDRVYVAFAGASNSEVGYFPAGGGSVTYISVSGGPFFVAARPDGTKVYASLNIAAQTASITTGASPVVAYIADAGGAPFGVAVAATPTGNRVFTADSNGNGFGYDVSRIDSATDTLLGQLFVGKKPKGVAASPNGTRVYVAASGDKKVNVIDTTQ
jgi:YVTN family beta-propeller protein